MECGEKPQEFSVLLRKQAFFQIRFNERKMMHVGSFPEKEMGQKSACHGLVPKRLYQVAWWIQYGGAFSRKEDSHPFRR
jgi:hypothetical protein